MTVHSVPCIVALSIAAAIGHPTTYRHTCIPWEGEKGLKIKGVKFDKIDRLTYKYHLSDI